MQDYSDEYRQLYYILAERSFAGIYVVQEGKFVYLNPNAALYVGYVPEELIGRDSISLVHPDDREMAKNNARRMLRGESSVPYEFRVITKQGQIRWIQETVTPIAWNGKRAVLGNALDVTFKKEMDLVLRKSELYFRSLFENLNDAAFVMEEDRFIRCNRKALELFRCKLEDIIGETPYEHFSPSHQPDGRPSREAALEYIRRAKEGEPQVFTWVHRRLDGEDFETIVSLSRIFEPGGEVHLIAIVHDITELKRIEDALRESELQFRTLVEQTPDFIFRVDRRGMFTYANPRFEDLLGYTRDELYGKPFTIVVAPYCIDTVRANFKRGIRGEFIQPYEADLLAKDGTVYPVEFMTTTLWDEEKRPIGRFGIGRRIEERRKAEKHTKDAYAFLRNVLDFSPDATVVLDREKKVVIWNRAMEELTGVPASQVVGTDDYSLPFYGYKRHIVADLILGTGESADTDIFQSLRREGETVIAEVEVVFPQTRKKRAIWIQAAPLRDEQGALMGAIETIRDITEMRQREEALRLSEERYRSIIENMGDGYYEVDLRGNILYMNSAAIQITGRRRDELIGASFRILASEADAQRIYEVFNEVFRTGSTLKRVDWKMMRPDGKEQYVQVTVSLVRDVEGRVTGFRGIIHDVTEQRLYAEKIQWMAYHDVLTGLPNRALFMDRLRQMLAHVKRVEERFVVMLVDLDNFKEVNDSYGHDIGDELLKEISLQMRSKLRERDTVARLGGDEFILLFPGVKDKRSACKVGDKVLKIVNNKYRIRDVEFNVAASVGIVMSPDDGKDADELVRKADLAMYRAKAKGGRRYEFASM
ncbi:MAG: PAS domain S-box protein [Syntrophales bacterium]|nr:PAS domain S-box protein [Syntrophales bacterium]